MNDINKYFQLPLEYYLVLSEYILDFNYQIHSYDINNLARELIQFALNLSKEGALNEQLFNYKLAYEKY